MAEAATFAKLWIPFCRKHSIECRNPEKYFNSKENPYKNQSHTDFVNDRRRVKRQFHDFEIRINGLSELIRQRSDIYHEVEESKVTELQREVAGSDLVELIPIAKATWMSNGIHWPGTWKDPSSPEHTYGHHAGMVQVMLKPPNDEPLFGNYEEATSLDFTGIDIRLPMLVYISREKHSEYEHNKKAGALNALLRASGVMSNGPFILDLDCNQYIYNSQSLRKGICFMMDRDGDQLCYVQFPQSFDPSDCHVSNNSVFLNVNMRALDGLQGPVYVGTGCLFRRIALYGFDPSRSREHHAGCCFSCCFPQKRKSQTAVASEETHTLHLGDYKDDEATSTFFQKFGNSSFLINSIPVAELKGRPLADNPAVKYGRQPGILTAPRELLDSSVVAEALRVVSSWYEDKTEWGYGVGWIYGSLTQNIVTGYRMHNQGWKSVYCVTDAFRRTAPMNLTDQLHQMLQQATDSVEIFFSSNNALFASSKMKILQRVAYLNVTIYPFTSIFFVVYCFLPALSLFTEQFIVQALHGTFLMYLLIITLIVSMLSILETKWSDITLEEWWRNKQFWLIGGTSAHLTALLKGFLKIIAGSELACTSTLFSFISALFSSTFAAPYNRNWTPLLILPITIVMVNLIVIAVGIGQAIYRVMPIPQRSKLLGSVFFSFWVLAHLYPVAKGLMGQRRRIPMIVFLWCGILSIGIWLLLWVAINPPSDSFNFP